MWGNKTLVQNTRLQVCCLIVLVIGALQIGGCADQPRIWFENGRDEEVAVSIDGDRLILLAPRSGQYLPYSTAAWAWPRRIDIATRQGTPIWSERMDADDLARNRWTVIIRS